MALLLKVENFQLQNFFPTENLCRPITFYKIFFLRKIFLEITQPTYNSASCEIEAKLLLSTLVMRMIM